MNRSWGVRTFGGPLRLALALALSSVSSAHIAGCSSEDSNDTGVSRSSDDDDDDGKGNEDPNEELTPTEYYGAMCDYYTRCSSAIRGLYGNKEQCLEFYLNLIGPLSPSADAENSPAYVNDACLRNVESVQCPSTSVLDREPIEVYLSFGREMFKCMDTDGLPCRDDYACRGRCSAQGGECGVCEPLPEGECGSSYDCGAGEVCWGEVCAPPRATGSECAYAEQCASGHCKDSTCIEASPEGGDCETTLDCGSYLWCKDGTCARPGLAGTACDVGTPLSCQIGYGCHQGTCQAVGYADVPVGGLCASTASCVAGATCTIESVCEATGDACATDSHCREGEYCAATCLPKLELGADCSRDLSCKSSYCSEAGVCAERNTCE